MVPQLRRGMEQERVVVAESEEGGRTRAVWLQKIVGCMKDLVSKVSNGGELDVDPCAGIFLMVKVCMMLPKLQRFVGCEIDAMCFIVSQQSDVQMIS